MWWPLPVRSRGDHTVSMWATIRLNPALRQRDTRGPGLKTPGHLSLKCDWLGSNERKPPLQRELWSFGLLQCWLNIQQSDTSWLLLFFFFKPWAKQYGRSRKTSGWRWRRKSQWHFLLIQHGGSFKGATSGVPELWVRISFYSLVLGSLILGISCLFSSNGLPFILNPSGFS